MQIAKKHYLIGGAAALVLVFAVGGFFYWKNARSPLPLPRTSQGLAFEELLPENAALAAVFRPTDEVQWRDFKKLWTAVLQDKSDAAPIYIARKLMENQNTKLSIEKFQELFAGNFSAAYSVAPGEEEGDEPEIYVLLSTANPAEAKSLLKNMAQQEDKVLKDEEGLILVQQGADQGIFYGITSDVIFLVQAPQERAEKIISRSGNARGSFSRNSNFRKFADKLSESGVGYVFGSSQSNQNLVPNSSISSFSLLRAREDGLLLETTAFKPSKADELTSKIFDPFTPSLYKSLPAAGTVMFSEGSRLATVTRLNMAKISQEKGEKNPDMFSQFKKITGFDFEADLAPFLDKGFAFAWHDSGSLFPGLTFIVDAGGAPEKAAKVINRLSEKIPGWIALGNIVLKSEKDAPIFSHKKFAKISRGGVAVIDFKNIPEGTAPVPAFEFIIEPLEVSYGLTDDNKLFFSTLPGFEQALAPENSIQNHPLFAEMEGLGLGLSSIAFIDGSAVGSYVSRIAAILKEGEKISEEELEGYAFLQKHLAPIQGFVQVSQGDGEKLYGRGFLKIATPQ